MKRAAFIGRWQPFHYGHQWLIRQKLDHEIPVLIMIRDIPPDERNPYTVDQTERMIYAAFESYGDEVSIITIPDIESINWGRGVGYETNEHPAAPLHVSGTEIRSRIAAGESISEFVCPAVEKVLREIS